MIIKTETSITTFEAWCGAKYTQEKIINAGLAEDFDSMIEELYPDGIDETTLNDILWFEDKRIFETLGIEEDED